MNDGGDRANDENAPRARAGGLKPALKLAAVVLFGLGLLVAVFWNVDLAEFWTAITEIRILWWLFSFTCFVALHLARTYRWGRVVERIQPVPFRHILSVSSVGFMAIQALPFRLGEFARPYLLVEKRDMPFGSAMYTVVVERTIDILCLAILFTIAVVFADIPLASFNIGEWEVNFVDEGRKAIIIALVPFGGCLLAFLILQERAIRWTEALVRPIHAGLATKAAGMMGTFLEGVRTMQDWRFAFTMVWTSLVTWGVNIVCMWSLCRAFGFDQLSLMAGLVILVVLIVGVLLPAPPLFAGIFEAFVAGSLVLYGIPREQGLAYAVVCHVTQTIILFGFGLFFLWADKISFRKIIDFARQLREGEGDAPVGSE